MCIAHSRDFSPERGMLARDAATQTVQDEARAQVVLQFLRGEEAISPQLSPPHCVRPHRIPGGRDYCGSKNTELEAVEAIRDPTPHELAHRRPPRLRAVWRFRPPRSA